eukprot:scaffold15408_cov41-Cyclotella_meneghiniana.AAC.10
MVEHSISDVIKWSRQHMSAILRNLEEMRKQYLRELKIEEEGLQPITAFFSPEILDSGSLAMRLTPHCQANKNFA